MKADEPRSPTKHVLEHPVPTVIHHPEEDMNQLRRWLTHVQENPLKFWGAIGALTLLLLIGSIIGNGLSFGKAAKDEAWTELETAKTAAERVEIANTYPNTPASRWALLQAATEYYNQGFAELPSNKDLALPTLKKSLDLFQKVAESAEPDSTQARISMLGVARTLEARNDLDKAIKQYEKVAANKGWGDTEEGKLAAKQAQLLKTPEAVTFYKDLYAYKAPTVDLPPGGTSDLNFPLNSMIPRPGAPGSGMVPGAPPIPFTLPTLPTTTTPPATVKTVEPNPIDVPPPPASPTPKAGEMPQDVFAPRTKTEPRAAEPKAESKPETKAALPSDPFAPGEKK